MTYTLITLAFVIGVLTGYFVPKMKFWRKVIPDEQIIIDIKINSEQAIKDIDKVSRMVDELNRRSLEINQNLKRL